MGADRTSATSLSCLLNGRPVRLDEVPLHTTLLEFLRARGLTGAKEGCAEGECGACAVAVVVPDGDGRSAYRVINSCLTFARAAADHEIYTVEALSRHGELSEVQQALASAGGSQCGYCTPGFVMSLFAEQYRTDRHGPCDPLALSGNLCRCTGYRPIRDAVLAVGPPPQGAWLDRLGRPAPVVRAVDGPCFSRPATVEEAVALLRSDPTATVLAGGSDLAVDSNLKGHRPAHLVSLEAVGELREFSETDERISIGAALPLTDIAARWTSGPDVFREWLELFASPPIRNRATLGGNLATASPIGDAAPLLMALDALVHVAGRAGRTAVPLSSFFRAYRQTALGPGDIVTAVEIPKPLPAIVRFYKVAKRRLDDISTVAAAFALDFDGSAGRVRRARFAFGGMAATPIRLTDGEALVERESWNETAVGRMQEVIQRTLVPLSDHRGSKGYRLEVAKCLVEKFWWENRT